MTPWRALCHTLADFGVDMRDAVNLFEEVMRSAYDSPRRAYHNLRHIEQCLGALAACDFRPGFGVDTVDALDEMLAEAQLAIWFHDVVCEPGEDDNERRSHDVFSRWASSKIPDKRRSARVARAILATNHREAKSRELYGGPVSDLVCDADMSILAAQWGEFALYDARVCSEYVDAKACTPQQWDAGRRGFLAAVLGARRIYNTHEFAPLEMPARANVTRLLEEKYR